MKKLECFEIYTIYIHIYIERETEREIHFENYLLKSILSTLK